MKIESYAVCKPSSYTKSSHILVKEEGTNIHCPLVYFRRPKGIEDDQTWETIMKSIRLELPVGFEIK